MTFVVNVEDEAKSNNLFKQLQKQIDVIKVDDITEKSIVMRELALVKVISPPHIRMEMNSIIEPFRATIDTWVKMSLLIKLQETRKKLKHLSI